MQKCVLWELNAMLLSKILSAFSTVEIGPTKVQEYVLEI